MKNIRVVASLVAFLVTGASLRAQAPELHVIRRSPLDSGTSGSIIGVAFDRPVAGMLGRSVDPATIFHVSPAIEGTLQWRDPATIQLIPKRSLEPGESFQVEIDTTFTAVDGTRLVGPYRFSFRVPSPKLIGTFSAANGDSVFRLVFSGPLDSATLARLDANSRLETTRECAADVGLHVVRQVAIDKNDNWSILTARAIPGDTAGDGFRRVVELAPRRAIPDGCAGKWHVPSLDPSTPRNVDAFAFNTRPVFAVISPNCRYECSERALGVTFTAPVTRSEMERSLSIEPNVSVKLERNYWQPTSAHWSLQGEFAPGATYTVRVLKTLKDVNGRQLGRDAVLSYTIPDRPVSVSYRSGLLSVSPEHLTLRVRHTNVDSLIVVTKAVPETGRREAIMGPRDYPTWFAQLPDSTVRRIAVAAAFNETRDVAVEIPRVGPPGALVAVVVRGVGNKLAATQWRDGPRPAPIPANHVASPSVTILQPTNVVAHSRLGVEKSVMFVSSATTGKPLAGASVFLRDGLGKVLGQGRTGRDGTVTLTHSQLYPKCRDRGTSVRAAYVDVEARGDRVAWAIPGFCDRNTEYAGAVFTDRGIYRPHEIVHIEAIVRRGMLGSLEPVRTDSVRLRVEPVDRQEADSDHVTTLIPSEFGTAVDSLRLTDAARLGPYVAEVEVKQQDRWVWVASTVFQVAEYRAPEFAVDARIDRTWAIAGDSLPVNVNARYLFGAPMAGAEVTWSVSAQRVGWWGLKIPNTEGFMVGPWSDAWGFGGERVPMLNGTGTTGADGSLRFSVRPDLSAIAGAANVTVDVAVTDANRQVVTRSARITMAASDPYLAVRDVKRSWFWRTGSPDSIEVIAVRPNGERVRKIAFDAYLLRRVATDEGRWRTDTVARTTALTDSVPVRIGFTPSESGEYQVHLVGRDSNQRPILASLWEYALGWSTSANATALSVVAPRDTLHVGDVATVAYENPFPRAEVWITIERERVIEQRRATVGKGMQEIRVPIRDTYAPNIFVSVVLVNQRSAYSTDTLSALVREGRASLTITRDARKLDIAIDPARRELGPSDTATIDLRLRDHGKPVRGEATLWAVDEGVLSLTDFATPDVLASIYEPRYGTAYYLSGLRSRVADPQSSEEALRLRGAVGENRLEAVVLTASAAPQLPEVTVRSDFQTTAFYLGQVKTDATGHARLRAKLPDNLTTFRLMAVGVTNDRYGSAADSLLVTRSVVVRPALPRFVRAGDSVYAGATINIRSGVEQPATLTINASGVALRSPDTTHLMASGQAHEARWSFVVPDSAPAPEAHFRFAGAARDGADRVDADLPVRAAVVPRAHTIAGVVHGKTDIEFQLPADIDPAKSRITLERAASPLGVLKWAFQYLRFYPYDCTEQLTSAGRAMVAVYRARAMLDSSARAALFGDKDPLALVRQTAAELSRRQRDDGAIRYWPSDDWSTPSLSASAGLFLVEAREVGVEVEPRTIKGIGDYLGAILRTQPLFGDTTLGTNASRRKQIQTQLAERVVIVHFLRRAGMPMLDEERRLADVADRMAWEDRVLLAEVVGTWNDVAARALLDAAWKSVTLAGRRIDLADSTLGGGDFPSHVRPAARLLNATLALRPEHTMLGALAETILQIGRSERGWSWNTQDYSSAIVAIARLARGQATTAAKGSSLFTPTYANRAVLSLPGRDTSVSLVGLVHQDCGSTSAERCTAPARVPLTLVGGDAATPLYFAVTITEIPRAKSTIADDQGIFVERWYERFADRQLVTSVEEGDLVRVHLRVTVPSDRQFVAVDDALPAGLEAVDLSLRTSATLGAFTTAGSSDRQADLSKGMAPGMNWLYGSWEMGWWSPWEHRELRDDRVLYFARMLWKGTYEMSYVARATTAGSFVNPPVRAEEMYNPALQGRSVGTTFTVRSRAP